MRTVFVFLLAAGSASAQSITQRLQQCYLIADTSERKACIDAVMSPRGADSSQAWWIATKGVDSMSDARECTVSAYLATFAGNLQVFYVEGKSPRVAIVSKPYPGDPTYLRVDENTAIKSDDGPLLSTEQSADAIAQLRAGTSVRTRFNEWPSRVSIENVMNVTQIDASLDECEAYVRGAE